MIRKLTAVAFIAISLICINACGQESKEKTEKVADKGNMVFVQGGEFEMGSNSGQDDEKPVHRVKVSDFWIGKYEVTVAEFKEFIDATNYKTDAEKGEGSYIINGTNFAVKSGVSWRDDEEGNRRNTSEYKHPVIHVSWNDAVAYCEWLSKKRGEKYRLPSEAEWEYSARSGGKEVKYSWGNGSPNGNVGDETLKKKLGIEDARLFNGYTDGYAYSSPVGTYKANEIGLYDMTGNVLEWCSDWYGDYPSSLVTDPQGPSSGSRRVLRGGSWGSDAGYCRVAVRYFFIPDGRIYGLGFRVALGR